MQKRQNKRVYSELKTSQPYQEISTLKAKGLKRRSVEKISFALNFMNDQIASKQTCCFVVSDNGTTGAIDSFQPIICRY